MSAVQLPQLSGSSSSTKARTVTGTAGPFNSSSRSSSQDTRSASPNPSTVPRIADQHKLPPGSPKNSSPRTLVARKDNFSLSANTSPIMSPSPNDRGRTPGRAIISGGLGGDDTRGRSLTPISPARSLRKLDSMDPPTSGSRNTTTASRSPSPAVIPPPSSLSNVPPGTSSGRPKAHAPSPLAQGLRSLEPLKTQDDNLPPFSYTSSQRPMLVMVR
ncbi:hypothetical protein BC829DRAFT_248561 [Chytridium lagenaria]|nr:hypothetical protein BC829DRAFT_248561 [Chytridium lagenaria]